MDITPEPGSALEAVRAFERTLEAGMAEIKRMIDELIEQRDREAGREG